MSSKKIVKKRKRKVNSAESKTKIINSVNRVISPPDHIVMDKLDLINFDAIVEELPKIEWTDHRLALACQISKMMTDIEEHHEKLREEDVIMEGENKRMIVNPRKNIVKDYQASIIALRRTLGLHAVSNGVRKGDLSNRLDNAKKMEKGASKVMAHRLIATPDKIIH